MPATKAAAAGDPITDKIIQAVKESTGARPVLPGSTLTALGISGNPKLSAFATNLCGKIDKLILSGKDLNTLLEPTPKDTVLKVRTVVGRRILAPVPRPPILKGIKDVIKAAWGGTTADQGHPFSSDPPAGRGKSQDDIDDLLKPLNAKFLDIMHELLTKSDLKNVQSPADIASAIDNKLKAAGR